MKETLTKLATGLIAKLIRHALTAAGGVAAATSGANGESIDETQLAAGVASVLISWGWSVWEDQVKKREAARLAATAARASTPAAVKPLPLP